MYVICTNCREGLRVVGELAEVKSLIEDRAEHRCYACGGECEVGLFADNDLIREKRIRTLTPMEAHLALEGLGLPEERECAAEIVVGVFQQKKVTNVLARSVPNTGRSVIDSIEFEDGTTVFLGSSTHGALVYRIRRPHSYTEAALGNI